MRGLPRLLSKPWNLLMRKSKSNVSDKTSGNQAKEVMEALEKLLDNKFGEE